MACCTLWTWLFSNIIDGKLYISFSIATLGLTLWWHCVLLSQRRDDCETAALVWVRRSLVKHVKLYFIIGNKKVEIDMLLNNFL